MAIMRMIRVKSYPGAYMKVGLLVAITYTVVFSGCSHKKYRVKKLKPLDDITAQCVQSTQQITVRAKKWSSRESKNFFYGVDLVRKNHNIQPIQITIENKRDADITCKVRVRDGMRLRKALVARQLHIGCGPVIAVTSAAGIAAWFLLAGSCASLIIGGAYSSVHTGAFTAAGILGAAGVICLLGVPLYMTYYRTTVNRLIDEQVALNSLYKSNCVRAHDMVNGLVYSRCSQSSIMLVCYEKSQEVASFDLLC